MHSTSARVVPKIWLKSDLIENFVKTKVKNLSWVDNEVSQSEYKTNIRGRLTARKKACGQVNIVFIVLDNVMPDY